MSYMLELEHKGLPFIFSDEGIIFDIDDPRVRMAMALGDTKIIEALREAWKHQTWIREMLDEQKSSAEFNEALKIVKERWALK